MDIPDIPLSHFVLNFDRRRPGRHLARPLHGRGAGVPDELHRLERRATHGTVPSTVQGCSGGGGGGGGGGGHAKPKARMKVTKASSDNPHLKLVVSDRAEGSRGPS